MPLQVGLLANAARPGCILLCERTRAHLCSGEINAVGPSRSDAVAPTAEAHGQHAAPPRMHEYADRIVACKSQVLKGMVHFELSTV